MYKCSQSSLLPHLIWNFLIVLKFLFLMSVVQHGFFFKGVSSLSVMCSAGNVHAFLDDVAGLYDVSLSLNQNCHQTKV